MGEVNVCVADGHLDGIGERQRFSDHPSRRRLGGFLRENGVKRRRKDVTCCQEAVPYRKATSVPLSFEHHNYDHVLIECISSAIHVCFVYA